MPDFNKTGPIVIDLESKKPQALDRESGGYPYDAKTPEDVHFFSSLGAAKMFADRRWGDTLKLGVVIATITLRYHDIDVEC